jgi:CDP-paratose 2-epimerase
MLCGRDLENRLGICQWFHFEDRIAVRRACVELRRLNVRLLRTDISWADACRSDGFSWYRWMFRELSVYGNLEILPCIYMTPPSLSENGKINGPPERLASYAEFVERCINEVGKYVGSVWELWNEPNNDVKWDQELDPFDKGRKKQGMMLRLAANVVHAAGFKPILGGMSPIDHGWLDLMDSCGAMRHCDTVAIHAFPGMWNDVEWKGWGHMADHLAEYFLGKPIWITEVGRATTGPDGTNQDQVQCLRDVVAALLKYPILERAYFYSLFDLPRGRDEIEISTGGYEISAEHALGLIKESGRPKPAYDEFKSLIR